MLSPLKSLNEFFINNPSVFAAFEYANITFIFLINLASLVHSFNGTRHPFPMVMSAVVMINTIFYCPYIYMNLKDY